MKKILIAIPCMDMVDTPFCTSLASLQAPEGCTLTTFTLQGSLIYESRNNLSAYAVQNNFDYVMWLDSDMQFESDIIVRLYDHMKQGKTVVSGLYFRRVKPFTPVLFKTLDYNTNKWEDFLDYPKDSVFKVEGMGFGCVMTDTQVFFDIARECDGKFFTPTKNMGEDLAFCWRARQAGHELWCDSSIKCAHWGRIAITEDFYNSFKEQNNK